MKYDYELIDYEDGLPLKAFFHSLSKYKLHWHKEMEIIYVLKGSIHVNLEKESFTLKENDTILINSYEVHSTDSVTEDNMLLVLQINTDFCNSIHPGIKNLYFKKKSSGAPENGPVNGDKAISYYMSKIVWELNKKTEGYRFTVMSYLNSLMGYILKNFDIIQKKPENISSHENSLKRLKKIMDYVNENYAEKISLKEVAREEYLNFYYLSHLFKGKVGMTFQEYVNNVRLEKALEALKEKDKKISEISDSCGFSSINTFKENFKKKYHCTPSEYRNLLSKSSSPEYTTPKTGDAGKADGSYISFSSTNVMDTILESLKTDQEQVFSENTCNESIVVNAQKKGKAFHKYWKKLTTFGRAVEGLRSDWQEQLREVQREIGFEYIRFHGIFNDEMMVFNQTRDGKIYYNWSYVNKLLDFFMEVGIKPFLELSFMPSEIGSDDRTVFWWKGNISQPREITLWTDMVKAFAKNCINRYGLKEVESWYFEIWNEPDFEDICWAGSRSDYFRFYKETALALRSVWDKLKVGGPSILYTSILNDDWLEAFLSFCRDNQVPLDFISFHIYHEKLPVEFIKRTAGTAGKRSLPFEQLQQEFHDASIVSQTIKTAMDKSEKFYGKKLDLHVTEWNISSNSRSLIRDTAFMAPYILKNVLECRETVDSLGFWTFTDIMEEWKAGPSPFHGGLGMINGDGIKKPSYLAFYLLSKLGDLLLEQGKNYAVTRSGENLQMILYNDAYFDAMAMKGDFSGMTSLRRYSIYEEKAVRNIEILFTGLSGNYKLTRYDLDRENGSAFDEWVNMGAVNALTAEEIRYLKSKAFPRITVRQLTIENSCKVPVSVPVHGCVLITLEKELL
ncbi:MAG: helix-turn-helix domain-containing protein [Clostridiales bacterium]|jgi:xylan 1,4-beta-xylosidase|nr:helix-turn-helix domain-containing protein [Eubacteriales bacterium]MDH7566447.1 helix-turn-helix domain-containing protein [Clostridiales bacterium]